MNSVCLIGNLASDVEIRDVGDEKKVASFLLAVDRGGRDAGADFVGVSVWDRQAEVCAEYLTKGRRIGVDGYLRSRDWEEEGRRRRVVEVVGRRVDFLGGPKREEEGAEVIPFEAAAAN
ncbi:MAG TPA: single-stranded DNA-binding protein [Gaiellaceae bacterium]|jgi:single-strand DNA-binding protein